MYIYGVGVEGQVNLTELALTAGLNDLLLEPWRTTLPLQPKPLKSLNELPALPSITFFIGSELSRPKQPEVPSPVSCVFRPLRTR